MTLIKSISGIRGTIGGEVGQGLTPIDIVKFTYAYCVQLKHRLPKPKGYKYTVVVGRDARISGAMVEQLVCGTLISCGVNVINAGMASTPTTEMAVVFSNADGGIILTASHNPRQWNALKLLNEKGEFLTAAEGQAILDCADKGDFNFSSVDELGTIEYKDFTQAHLDAVCALETVNVNAIKEAKFKVVLDAVNSVGGIIVPRLLDMLGVECVCINCEPTGNFAHNPEPLPQNLQELSREVVAQGADLGISVDPDVDRLVFICENGDAFVEEYTLVSVAEYLFSFIENKAKKLGIPVKDVVKPYNMVAVSNLSSSMALKDVALSYNGQYYAAAVGEVNVTTKMKECGALIGGEGNGGVIYPALHYGRDAMVGLALFLTLLAERKVKVSELKATYPAYFIAKNKIELADNKLIDKVLLELKQIYRNENVTDIDGVKITFESAKQWVHLRKSNTEPIIRIYAEAPSLNQAEQLAQKVINVAQEIITK